MYKLPQHKASQVSSFGVRLRKADTPQDGGVPVTYAHQDDYYIIGLVERGAGRGIIDFKEYDFAQGDIFLIRPGQVHRFVGSEGVGGWMLFADSSFVGSTEKRIFDDFSLFAQSLKVDGRRMDELTRTAAVLAERLEYTADELGRAVARRLTEAFVGIVAEALQADNPSSMEKHSRRHVEIVLSFRRLLTDHLTRSRQPSYYAALLHLSPVYLNEAVKAVTGMSATLYIRSEMALQAKRLLAHTTLSVKEIAGSLGVDDYAYFSRLFTQATGISPTRFRQRNLG